MVGAVTVLSSPRLRPSLRRSGTAILVSQLIVLTSAAWLATLYARALAATGSHAALGSISPDTLIPFGTGAANPFTWLHTLAVFMLVFGYGAGALLALAGLVLSLLTDLRHDRRRARTLLVTSLLCVAVALALSTGFGDDLHYWFIPD